jgi:hypothetical protein
MVYNRVMRVACVVLVGCGFHGGSSAADGALADAARDARVVDGEPIDARDAPGPPPIDFVFEAEAASSVTVGDPAGRQESWTVESSATESAVTGYSGLGFLHLLPGDGYTCDSTALGACAIASYALTIATPGTYYVHLRLYATGTNNNSVYAGLDGTAATGTQISVANDSAWHWATSASFTLAAGAHAIGVWQREAGVRLDLVVVSSSATTPALP